MKGKVVKRVASAAWKTAKPILKKQGRKLMQKKGEEYKAKTKSYLGKKADKLIDRGADKVGIKDSGLRSSAKATARKGIGKGVDVGAAYITKKLQ